MKCDSHSLLNQTVVFSTAFLQLEAYLQVQVITETLNINPLESSRLELIELIFRFIYTVASYSLINARMTHAKNYGLPSQIGLISCDRRIP